MLIPRVVFPVRPHKPRTKLSLTLDRRCFGAWVSEPFPAPNAWIPGGYRPFHAKLAALVNENAPL